MVEDAVTNIEAVDLVEGGATLVGEALFGEPEIGGTETLVKIELKRV